MSATYPDFFVKIDNLNFSFTPVSGATVKAYNVSTQMDLGVSLGPTGSDGKISGGTFSGASNGDLIRFRVEDDGVGRAGFNEINAGSSNSMDIILRPSNGVNILLRPQARPIYYKDPTVVPALAEVFWLVDGDPITSAQSLGFFPIGQQIRLSQNPSKDRNFWLIPNPINAFGVYAYGSLLDVPETQRYLVVIQRENNPPTISQYSAASTTSVTLLVSGYSPKFTGFRRIQSTDSGATQQVEKITVAGTVGTTGTLVVTVTAPGMNLSPKSITVNVTSGDSANTVATNIANTLSADPDVDRFFTVTDAHPDVEMTTRFGTANDPTINLALAHGTATGVTPVPISTNVTPGAASANEKNQVVDVISGVANSNYQFSSIAADTSAQVRHYRVAHSSKSATGPWSPWSNVLDVTFAGTVSGGGSGGTTDPTPPDKLPADEIE